jgi:4-hydroxy-2-oxoglutarate aldolase
LRSDLKKTLKKGPKEGFRGIFAALTTPFVGEDISTEKLRENISRYNRTDLAGYVVLGSTGEAVFLSDQESEKLAAAAISAASSGKKIIVGASRESTLRTIQFTNRAAGLGADAALIQPPHYYKSRMSQAALKEHYLRIADKSKLPLLIYNIPQNTGISVDPPLVVELSHHPNIAGIKDSSGNLANLVESLPGARRSFAFLLGAGSVLWPGLALGASGGILAMAAAVPELCTRLYTLFRKGNIQEAKKLQLDLVPLNKALTQTLGIPAIKYALDLLGYYGGPPRLPLEPLEKREKREVVSLLENLGWPGRQPAEKKGRK